MEIVVCSRYSNNFRYNSNIWIVILTEVVHFASENRKRMYFLQIKLISNTTDSLDQICWFEKEACGSMTTKPNHSHSPRVSKEEIWAQSVNQEINFNCHNHKCGTSSLETPPVTGQPRSSVRCVVLVVTVAAKAFSRSSNHDLLPPRSVFSPELRKHVKLNTFTPLVCFTCLPALAVAGGLMCDLSEVVF